MAKKAKKPARGAHTPKTVDQLLQDQSNRRQRTDRGRAMIAESLRAVGAARSVVIDESGQLLAGNGVAEGAAAVGISKLKIIDVDGDTLVAVRRSDLSPEDKRLLAMYDNRTGELAEWNIEQLRADAGAGLNLAPFFFPDELTSIFGILADTAPRGRTDPDAIPDGRRTSIQAGDFFELGEHRLLCGDTTDPATVARLVKGRGPLQLIHADPPYGMGKEKDGIANDNLYEDKLDAFQLTWWAPWLEHLSENGSAYIWGNAADLWRLWWSGGLRTSAKDLMVRNEIVWDKGAGFGMASALHHQFPTATERCLFIMRGQQFLGNQNVADYWPGYEPLREWLEKERDRAGWSNGDVNKITKTHMAGHWFTKSQFAPISRQHYETLAAAAQGRAFTEPYEELFARMFKEVKEGGNAHRRDLSAAMRESRTFFDNTHEAMTDVWQFPRVHGEERYGHATPKPVAMVRRAIVSSCDKGQALGVPFAGTGPELIAAEGIGRACLAMEIEPRYCQIIIDRWEAFTGKKASKVGEVARKSTKAKATGKKKRKTAA